MSHRNAPLPVEGRRRLVARCQTRPIAHVAAETGQIPDGGGWRIHGKDSEHARHVARGKTRGQRARFSVSHSQLRVE